MKQLLILLFALTIFSCGKSTHKTKPSQRFEVYAFFHKDTSQNLYADHLLEVKGEVFKIDSSDSTHNIYSYDSAFWYLTSDTTKKFKSKSGADSFGVKAFYIPSNWVRAIVKKQYYKH